MNGLHRHLKLGRVTVSLAPGDVVVDSAKPRGLNFRADGCSNAGTHHCQDPTPLLNPGRDCYDTSVAVLSTVTSDWWKLSNPGLGSHREVFLEAEQYMHRPVTDQLLRARWDPGHWEVPSLTSLGRAALSSDAAAR
jgi:hypothetical protein